MLVDHTGRLDLVWFNQLYLARRIHPGMRVLVRGKAKQRGPTLQMANPQWEALADTAEPDGRGEQQRPVYPAREGLPSHAIENAVRAVLPDALARIDDHLPAAYRAERELPTLADAYRMMHAPETDEEPRLARRR